MMFNENEQMEMHLEYLVRKEIDQHCADLRISDDPERIKYLNHVLDVDYKALSWLKGRTGRPCSHCMTAMPSFLIWATDVELPERILGYCDVETPETINIKECTTK